MANLFNGLPHMIGQISNLSGNQVKRAMISIKSENRRRQRVFSENGVNNINAYTKLYKTGEARLPMPHLIIIIDEFAELKREEPEFMKELISVAQVGRSLGVHLILATQKPSGTVDDNIWSNSKFRLCLRVQDQMDSKDMLHKPDAAYITQPGRGYLQVGSDEVYELFQSGFSGAIFDDSMTIDNKDIAKMITTPGKVGMTGNSVKLSQKKHSDTLWIETLCKYMIGAEKRVGQKCCVDEDKRQVWLNALYDEFEQTGVDYPISDYNTARLIDFMQCFVTARKFCEENEKMAEMILNLAREENKKLPQAKSKTQLDVTKEYLFRVAKENQYDHQITLWMPVLEEKIYLSEFEEFNRKKYENGMWPEPEKEWGLPIVLGKMDDPENQNQMALTIDLAEDDNIGIYGTIVSGKSTTMQTMIYALIHKYTPEYISIYCIDYSSKMLGAFEQAPHIGGIMFEGDDDKIKKFFTMMENIVSERKKLFRGGNYKQYVRAKGVAMPAVLLFVDNYGAFKARTEEKYESFLLQLSKEGVGLGIYLIISGNGVGMNEITGRVAENLKTSICLEQKDKFGYAEFLHTTRVSVIPENGVKGRGLAYYGNRILEFQTALVFEAENNYICLEKINSICEEMQENWKGKCAKQIPEIPEKPIWSEFIKLEDYQNMLESKDYVPVGYNETNAQVYGVPLAEIYCYLICGAKRTGKTNFLKNFINSVLNKKNDVCIIDTSGELKKFEKEEVAYLKDEESIFVYFRDVLTPVFQARNNVKKKLIEEDKDEKEIYEEQSKEKSIFIFISDLNKFIELIYDSNKNMGRFIENIFEKGRFHNIYFVGELQGTKYGNLRGYAAFEIFVGYKTGIHFGGKVSDNAFLEYNSLSYSQQSAPEKMGIGMLPDAFEDGVSKVVIPLAK